VAVIVRELRESPETVEEAPHRESPPVRDRRGAGGRTEALVA